MLHFRPNLWLTLVLLTALTISNMPLTAAAHQATPDPATPPAMGEEQYTPVLASVPNVPQWFPGSDGQIHLAYEILLTNAFPVDVTVTSVEIADATTGARVALLEGDSLTGSMSLLATPQESSATIPPSTVGVVWLDVPLPDRASLPGSITHSITVAVPPGLPVPETITAAGPTVAVDQRDPIVLGAPLAGDQWTAIGSCCDGPHRRAFQPIDGTLYLSQRYAVDFNLLDDKDRLGYGDTTLNESTPGFGQPVLAVAYATVVTAVDGLPDQTPGSPPTGITLETADGNHVVLDLGNGRFAFYAHLRHGTVTVRTGDIVQMGDVIGELGNSGSSDGAHLHFHVMDGPSALGSNGMPYVFAQYDLTGQLPPLEEILPLYDAQLPIPVLEAGGQPEQHQTFPLGGTVMTFPPQPGKTS